MRQEIFYLAYHLHWPHSEIMDLDLGERRTYVRMLGERIEMENKAFESFTQSLGRG